MVPNESEKRLPSRRELIRPRLNRNETDSPIQNEEGIQADLGEGGPLVFFSANAMGCQFQILCEQHAVQPIAEAVQDGFELIQKLESRLTIFSETSEMAIINQMAGQQPVAVETTLYDLLKKGAEISRVSQGAFDLSATPLTRLWKQHRQERSLPDQAAIDSALDRVGFQHLRFDDSKQTISFDGRPLTLDLGGIGKGFALDRLAEFLALSDCHDFLIHGGQSSVISNGRRANPGNVGNETWQIGITHPLSPSVRLATIELRGCAIGTSGSGRKSFVHAGKRYGHIIDPRSGWPADQLLSVTVLADSAMLADALATTIFVTGSQQANQICEHFEVAAIMISQTSDQVELQIDSIGLADDQWKLVC